MECTDFENASTYIIIMHNTFSPFLYTKFPCYFII